MYLCRRRSVGRQRLGGVILSKKWSNRFLSAYIRLEEDCNVKFNLAKGGVTEYIRRLSNLRFAEGSPEVLRTLCNFRAMRNSMVHESDSVHRLNITRHDVNALRRFHADLKRQRDPLSRYLTRARRARIRRNLLRGGLVALILLALGAAAFAYFYFLR